MPFFIFFLKLREKAGEPREAPTHFAASKAERAPYSRGPTQARAAQSDKPMLLKKVFNLHE